MQRLIRRASLITLCFCLSAFAGTECISESQDQIQGLWESLSVVQDFKGEGSIVYVSKVDTKESIKGEINVEKTPEGWNLIREFCGKGWCATENNVLSLKDGCMKMDGENVEVTQITATEINFTRINREVKETYKLKLSAEDHLRLNISEFVGNRLRSTLTFKSNPK
ncbi:MAG TPA: hypothetical protein VNJ01_11270 [Bacteriovoracaceae bacterium]|nr:hypothetical protein [Bacteriovoracaceae bacterium]